MHSPRVVLVVQARMGSRRLPNKSMLKLAGEPLVGRILERLQRCQEVDEIVLATPSSTENDDLSALALRWSVRSIRGSEDDVLGRFVQAAKMSRADLVVRFPGDNPAPEPSEIDKIVIHHRARSERGFSTNICSIHGSGYPDGIGAEVFDAELLLEAVARQPTAIQREHVHRNFFDYASESEVDAEWCPVQTVPCPPDFRRPDICLDVNTDAEYQLMKHLYTDLYTANSCFSIHEIVSWWDEYVARAESGAGSE